MQVREKRVSKIELSIKNMFWGIGGQILLMLLSFINRTLFIKYLGIEYLGINSLFTNILFVLNLADLGLGTAITYSLYTPLAEKNLSKIKALIKFYKIIYQRIALAIFILGVLLLPFLDKIVNLDKNIDNIYIYYILYVINSALSYLFVYKTTIIFADQKSYILKKYAIITNLFNFIFQCIAITYFESFILYLLSMITFTFYNNYLGAKKADKMYLKNEQDCEVITKYEKKEIFSNVKSMFLYRISGVIMNNTTNIFISIFIGTIWVGYYSNYLMLVTAITSFMMIIISAIQASVGNLVCTENISRQYEIFRVINFLIYGLVGLISIYLYSFLDLFINLWIGREYILPYNIVILIVLNFFIPNSLYATWLFRDTTQLFKKTKYVALVTAIINIILILLLEKQFALFGILISAIFARLMTNFWYEPYLLFRNYFKISFTKYLLKISIYIFVLLCLALGNKFILEAFNISGVIKSISFMIIDAIFLLVVYCGIFYKTYEFMYLKKIVIEKYTR